MTRCENLLVQPHRVGKKPTGKFDSGLGMDLGFLTAVEYVSCMIMAASVIGFILMAMALSRNATSSPINDERDGVAIGWDDQTSHHHFTSFRSSVLGMAPQVPQQDGESRFQAASPVVSLISPLDV